MTNASDSQPTRNNTLYSLQSLRAIAASMVVVFHAYVHLKARNIIPELPPLVDVGRAGVDIFFVISGFIMIYVCRDKFGTQGATSDFLIRRFIRVVPIYWFYTLLIAAILLIAPQLFSQGKGFDLTHFFTSLAFIPWTNNIGQLKPVLNVGWTLNFEMYFYLVFSILLIFQKNMLLPMLTAILLFGVIIDQISGPYPDVMYVVTSPLLFEFLFGCYLGHWYLRNSTINSSIALLMILTGCTAFVLSGILDTSEISRVLKWGIPAALVVAGALIIERNGNLTWPTILVKLGDSSYSLYLCHIFVIGAVGKIWSITIGDFGLGFVICVSVISIISGHLSYLVLEKPITSKLSSIYHAHKKSKI